MAVQKYFIQHLITIQMSTLEYYVYCSRPWLEWILFIVYIWLVIYIKLKVTMIKHILYWKTIAKTNKNKKNIIFWKKTFNFVSNVTKKTINITLDNNINVYFRIFCLLQQALIRIKPAPTVWSLYVAVL